MTDPAAPPELTIGERLIHEADCAERIGFQRFELLLREAAAEIARLLAAQQELEEGLRQMAQHNETAQIAFSDTLTRAEVAEAVLETQRQRLEKAVAEEVPLGCNRLPHMSRTCERGTKCCTVRHTAAEAEQGRLLEDVNALIEKWRRIAHQHADAGGLVVAYAHRACADELEAAASLVGREAPTSLEALIERLAADECIGNRHESFLGNCPVCLDRYNKIKATLAGREAPQQTAQADVTILAPSIARNRALTCVWGG